MRNGVEARLALSLSLVARRSRCSGRSWRRREARLGCSSLQAAATAASAPLVAALARPVRRNTPGAATRVVTLLYPPLLGTRLRRVPRTRTLHAARAGDSFSAPIGDGWIGVRVLRRSLRSVCGKTPHLTLVFFGIAFCRNRAEARAQRPRTARRFRRCAARARDRRCGALAAGRRQRWTVYYGDRHAAAWRMGPGHFYVYPFANGPLALLVAPFTHPLQFVRAIFTFGRLTYVLEALVPLAFLPLRSRWSLARPSGRRDRFACQLRLRLADGRPLCRAVDSVAAASRTVSGRRVARAARGARVSPDVWTACGGGALRRLPDRVRSAASAALPSFVLSPILRRRAARHRLRAEGRVAGDPRRMVLGDCRAAAARDDRPRERRGVLRLCGRFSERGVPSSASARRSTREVARGEYRVVCRYGNVAAYEATDAR